MINAEFHESITAIARDLDKYLNGGVGGADRTTGFVLLIFPLGEREGRKCNCISNAANEADIVALMKETIMRFDEAGHA